MRRITVVRGIGLVIAASALIGCGSSAKGASSTLSSRAASSGPGTTLDAAASSSLDTNGATAVLTLFAAQVKASDPTITQTQADCIPPAVLARLTPQELFAILDATEGALSSDQAAKVGDALRSCGLTDTQIAKVPLR